MFFRKPIEGDHPVPVPLKGLDRLGVGGGEQGVELRLEEFTGLLGLCVRHLTQDLPGLRLYPARQLIENVENLMVPTSLLFALRIDFP